MNAVVLVVVLGLVAVQLVGTLVLLVRDQNAGDAYFVLLAVLEVALVVQAVVGCVALAQTSREVSGVTFVSYLIAVLFALPIGAFWSLAERTRSGTAVLLVAGFTVLAVELRLDAIWGGPVG